MGSGMSHFTKEEIEIYEACTCLNGSEIGEVYEKFLRMGGIRIGRGQEEQRIGKRIGNKTARNLHAPVVRDSYVASTEQVELGGEVNDLESQKVRCSDVCALPEFTNNPFVARFCQIFSSDGSGELNFDELLDMFHVLSPKVDTDVKVLMAFKAYDFDDDGYLSPEDLTKLLVKTTGAKKSQAGEGNQALHDSLTTATRDGENEAGRGAKKPRLDTDTMAAIIDHVMRACDLDGRGRLSFHEFERVMKKFPDLEAKFSVNIQS